MTEDSFKEILEFLEQFDGRVTGRTSSKITDEDDAQLRRFTAGALTEAEREQLTHRLLSNFELKQRLLELIQSEQNDSDHD